MSQCTYFPISGPFYTKTTVPSKRHRQYHPLGHILLKVALPASLLSPYILKLESQVNSHRRGSIFAPSDNTQPWLHLPLSTWSACLIINFRSSRRHISLHMRFITVMLIPLRPYQLSEFSLRNHRNTSRQTSGRFAATSETMFACLQRALRVISNSSTLDLSNRIHETTTNELEVRTIGSPENLLGAFAIEIPSSIFKDNAVKSVETARSRHCVETRERPTLFPPPQFKSQFESHYCPRGERRCFEAAECRGTHFCLLPGHALSYYVSAFSFVCQTGAKTSSRDRYQSQTCIGGKDKLPFPPGRSRWHISRPCPRLLAFGRRRANTVAIRNLK